jgi:hypothetical protein
MAAQTRLIVTFYLQCLSCLICKERRAKYKEMLYRSINLQLTFKTLLRVVQPSRKKKNVNVCPVFI